MDSSDSDDGREPVIKPVDPDQDGISSGLISVKVTRGDDDGRHPIYETVVQYSKFYKPIEARGQYKVYKTISDKLEEITPKYLENILKVSFPEKNSKTKLGILGGGLNDMELRQRAQELDAWMKALLQNYANLNSEAQRVIQIFLGLEKDDAKHAVVIKMLEDCKVVGANIRHKSKVLIAETTIIEHTVLSSPISIEKADKSYPSALQQFSARSEISVVDAPSLNTNESSIPLKPVETTESATLATPHVQFSTHEQSKSYENRMGLVKTNFDNDAKSVADTVLSEEEAIRLSHILSKDYVTEKETILKYTGKSILIRTLLADCLSGHPMYETVTQCESGSTASSFRQFKQYRDLMKNLAKLGITDEVLLGPFPPTYRTSSLGIKLNTEQLNSRRFLLDVWVRRVALYYTEMKADARSLCDDFFNFHSNENILDKLAIGDVLETAIPPDDTDEHYESHVEEVAPLIEEQKTSAAPNSKYNSWTQSLFGKTTRKDVSKQIQGLFYRSHSSEDTASNAKASSVPDDTHTTYNYVAVIVKRADEDRGHPTYETILSIVNAKKDYTRIVEDGIGLGAVGVLETQYGKYCVTREFKTYRSLAGRILQSQKSGVVVDRKTITPPNEIVLPSFPPTFAKSKMGIKLTHEELRQRSLRLDIWMRALLASFTQLNHVSQDIVFEFFNLDSSQDLSTSVMTAEEKYYIDRIKEGFVLNRKHKIEGISVEIAIQHSRPGLAAVSKSGEPHAETTDQWLAIGSSVDRSMAKPATCCVVS